MARRPLSRLVPKQDEALTITTIGNGEDSLVLEISQDAYRGDAQYIIKVDGKQIGGTLTAKASHDTGKSDIVTVKGDWAPGSHEVQITFLNDMSGRDGDRNLYLNGATQNGTQLAGADLDFFWNETKGFQFTKAAATPVEEAPATPAPEPQPAPAPIPTPAPAPIATPGGAPAGAVHVAVGTDIQALVNAAPAGTTFWLEAGEHRMQSITPKNGQTFLGEEGASLNGSRLLTDWTLNNGDWYVGGQTQQGLRNATDEALPGFARGGYPDAVFLDDVPLTAVASRGAVESGTYFFDYNADRIYIGDDPAGRKVEAAVASFAFRDGGGVEGVTIQNLIVEKYATPASFAAIGYETEPVQWTVQDNEIRLNFGIGVGLSSNSLLLNNVIHNNGQMGMAGGGNNLLVQGNEVHTNGFWSGINPDWEGGGSKFAVTEDLVIRDNHVHGNNGYGLWTDIDNIRTLYEGNLVESNSAAGINHEISYDAVIRNNTLIGNGTGHSEWLWGAGIQIQNSRNVEIYGNTVETKGIGNGIALIQQDRGNVQDFGGTASHGSYVTIGNNVHDNVIIGNGASGAVADNDEAGLLAGANLFDRNTYRMSDISEDWFAYGDYYTWSQLQSVSGWEANGTLALL
jgi:hypothetical protein